MKIRKKNVFTIAIALICLAGLLCLSLSLFDWPSPTKGEIGIPISITSNNMKSLEIIVQDVAVETNTIPPQTMNELLAWIKNSKNMYFESGIIDPQFFKIDTTAGSIAVYDSWGNPLKLIIDSPKEYILVSFGPDGLDNNRQGDDIVHKFNPEIWKKDLPQ